MRRAVPLAFALWLGASSTTASAQTQGDPTRVAAEHNRRGTAAFTARHYAEAAGEFEAAFSLVGDASLVYNAALAWERVPDPTRAIADYRAYLEHAPNAPNRGDVDARIDFLQRMMNASSSPPPPASAAPAPVVVAHPAPPPHSPWRPVVLVAGGIAFLAAIGASVLYELAAAQYNYDLNHCAPTCGSAEVASIDEQTTVVNVLWGVTAVGGAVAIAAFALDLHARSDRTRASIRVAPIANGGAAVLVSGAF